MGFDYRSARHLRIALATLVAALAFVLLAPGGASAATLAQVRVQLLALHLQPPPLFPSQLPASHRGVNVRLYRWSGVDYIVGLGEPENADCHTLPNPTDWCVELRRTDASALGQMLHDPIDFPHPRHLRVGSRSVWFVQAENNAGGWWMAWHEQGRTYLAWAWTDERTALRWLTPVVESLRPLTGPRRACTALTFISVRGSGESSTGPSDMAASPVTQRIYTEMISRLPAGTPKPSFQQLPYEALSTDVLAAGVKKAPSLKAAVDRFFQNLAAYISGEKVGVVNLASFISRTEARCPHAGFVLAGYSQGAMVIHDYLALLATGSASERNAIRGVALVADPERMPDSWVLNFGTAQFDGYGVCHASEHILRVAVCVSGASTQDVPRAYRNVWQVCDDGDIVCDTSVLFHLNTLNGWKAQVEGGVITHTAYCVSGRYGSRCAQGVIEAGRALGQHVLNGMRASTTSARRRAGAKPRSAKLSQAAR